MIWRSLKFVQKMKKKIFVSCYSAWVCYYKYKEQLFWLKWTRDFEKCRHSRDLPQPIPVKSSKSNLRVTSVHNSVITNTGVWGEKKGLVGRGGWRCCSLLWKFSTKLDVSLPHFVSDCRCGRVRVKSCSWKEDRAQESMFKYNTNNILTGLAFWKESAFQRRQRSGSDEDLQIR